MVRVADSVPNAPGAKLTTIEHALPAFNIAPHVPPVFEKSAPLVPLKFSARVTA